MAAPVSLGDRASTLHQAASGHVDILVVGLGVTGAGVALDAASRGLSVLAVDAYDLAFGTSRWSSKLVHGGLRYLASGQLSIARESAAERDLLMRRTAPHLTRPMAMTMPLTDVMSRRQTAVTRLGLLAGDGLRAAAGTPRSLLPGPRRLSAAQTLRYTPGVRACALRGGLLSYDGQLEDDARLVLGLARTAASFGARFATRVRVLSAAEGGAVLRDELTGEQLSIKARAVVNATGVWAGDLAPELSLTPSRGTHLVLTRAALPGLHSALSAPVPGSLSRFVFALPQSDGLIYLGLTDEPAGGPVPDVPQPTSAETDFLLRTLSRILESPLDRSDVVGSFAGLRPLISLAGGAEGRGDGRADGGADGGLGGRSDGRETARLPRSHVVLTDRSGLITVVGGKLTTYRAMAQQAVDAAVSAARLTAGPCQTRDLPLLGAATRRQLASLSQGRDRATRRLIRRYGTEADEVVASAERRTGRPREDLCAELAPGVPTCRAELVWGLTHEGALDTADLLERRTRVALVPQHAAVLRPIADEVCEEVLG